MAELTPRWRLFGVSASKRGSAVFSFSHAHPLSSLPSLLFILDVSRPGNHWDNTKDLKRRRKACRDDEGPISRVGGARRRDLPTKTVIRLSSTRVDVYRRSFALPDLQTPNKIRHPQDLSVPACHPGFRPPILPFLLSSSRFRHPWTLLDSFSRPQ
ncbi:hypothetical protein F5880DRAFT_78520 [Lentinula raphanica]|nr:hypothetical protein F5880DRAFT_78520 [Lentinula raphanica]